MSAMNNCATKEYAPYITFSMDGWTDIIKNIPLERVKKGTVIYQHQANGNHLVLVKDGIVTMSFINTCGQERIHFFGAEGYVFGFRSCLSGRPYGGTLTAFTDVEIYRIPAETVNHAMQESSEFLKFVMLGEYERGQTYSRKLEFLSVSGSTQKVAVLLLSLAARIGKKGKYGMVIPLKLTHEIIARMIYSDRVTVSRAISQLEKASLIRKNYGFFVITDLDGLKATLNKED